MSLSKIATGDELRKLGMDDGLCRKVDEVRKLLTDLSESLERIQAADRTRTLMKRVSTAAPGDIELEAVVDRVVDKLRGGHNGYDLQKDA